MECSSFRLGKREKNSHTPSMTWHDTVLGNYIKNYVSGLERLVRSRKKCNRKWKMRGNERNSPTAEERKIWKISKLHDCFRFNENSVAIMRCHRLRVSLAKLSAFNNIRWGHGWRILRINSPSSLMKYFPRADDESGRWITVTNSVYSA